MYLCLLYLLSICLSFLLKRFPFCLFLVHLRESLESHDSLPIFILLASVIKYCSFTNFLSREVRLSIKTHFEEGWELEYHYHMLEPTH